MDPCRCIVKLSPEQERNEHQRVLGPLVRAQCPAQRGEGQRIAREYGKRLAQRARLALRRARRADHHDVARAPPHLRVRDRTSGIEVTLGKAAAKDVCRRAAGGVLAIRRDDFVNEGKSGRHLLRHTHIGGGKNDPAPAGVLPLRPGDEIVARRNTGDVERAACGDELPKCRAAAHQPVQNFEHRAGIAPNELQQALLPQVGLEQCAVPIDHQRNLIRRPAHGVQFRISSFPSRQHLLCPSAGSTVLHGFGLCRWHEFCVLSGITLVFHR